MLGKGGSRAGDGVVWVAVIAVLSAVVVIATGDANDGGGVGNGGVEGGFKSCGIAASGWWRLPVQRCWCLLLWR